MINVEPMVVLIRAYAVGTVYGDPYIWTATGIRIAHEVLEIVGTMGAPPPSVWREMHVELKKQGWKKVIFTRMFHDGRIEQHEVDLT